jgi:uncharacterized protein YlzI (FlbEa/FlbD family)
MIRLTEMNGDPIYILLTWIQTVRKARSYEPRGGARVTLSGESITVRESVEEIVAMLNMPATAPTPTNAPTPVAS